MPHSRTNCRRTSRADIWSQCSGCQRDLQQWNQGRDGRAAGGASRSSLLLSTSTSPRSKVDAQKTRKIKFHACRSLSFCLHSKKTPSLPFSVCLNVFESKSRLQNENETQTVRTEQRERAQGHTQFRSMKPARRLGTYGTSAFRAPSRQELNERAAAVLRNSLRATADGHASTTTTVEETFTPKSSFDEAARPDGIRGSTLSARLRSTKARFQQSHAERELQRRNQAAVIAEELTLGDTVSQQKQKLTSSIFSASSSTTPSRAARMAPDFARDKSPRIVPLNGRAESAGRAGSTTPSRQRASGSAAAAAAPFNTITSKAIVSSNEGDPLQHLTIAARAEKRAQRPDPVFATTVPRFKRLGTAASVAAAAAAAASFSSFGAAVADADFYVPRNGVADEAAKHALVKMSSGAAIARFPEKHSVTERVPFHAPRGFADEVLKRNEAIRRRQAAMASRSSSRSSRPGGISGVSGTVTDRSVTGTLMKPRFQDPVCLTAHCDMYAPPGMCDKISPSALTRRSPAFSRPVSPSAAQKRGKNGSEQEKQHGEQQQQQQSRHSSAGRRTESRKIEAAAQQMPDAAWTPKSLVDEILRKDTAGAAFRSTTPRFLPARKLALTSAAPLADLLETRDKPDIEGARRSAIITTATVSSSAPATGAISLRHKSPSSIFASKVPRWKDNRTGSSTISVDATYTPESFVDKILNK